MSKVNKDIKDIRKIIAESIKELYNDEMELNKANELSKLTKEFCKLVELNRGVNYECY